MLHPLVSQLRDVAEARALPPALPTPAGRQGQLGPHHVVHSLHLCTLHGMASDHALPGPRVYAPFVEHHIGLLA